MRLTEMGTHFIEGRKRRGLGMIVKLDEDGVTTLEYKNGEKIATITNRTSEGFTLTIHCYKYGSIYHANRIRAIFQAVKGDWKDKRYSSYMRWGQIKIWDYRLHIEMTLNKEISFTVRDNKPALDYTLLENACLTDETEKPKAITNPATNNSGEAINNLMALVANI